MTEPLAPIFVNLGRHSGKKLKALRKSEGPLYDEVMDAISEVRNSLGMSAEGKSILPVVVLYEKKSRDKKPKGRTGFLPFRF